MSATVAGADITEEEQWHAITACKSLQTRCVPSARASLNALQATASPGKQPHLSQWPSNEVTEQQLQAQEDDTAAGVVHMYTALLLGFVVEGSPELQSEAVQHLGSLQPIIIAIQECMEFYTQTGAINSQNEHSLRTLLTALQQTDAANA